MGCCGSSQAKADDINNLRPNPVLRFQAPTLLSMDKGDIYNTPKMSEITKEILDFNKMPEACLSHVLSLTSPQDSCVFSAVSTMFKSAVDSDTVWEKFLPSDYQEILNRTVEDIKFSSKRDLYFKLCSPILIDGGKMSFHLEKSSGAKCFMISARELSIAWGDTYYWQWIQMSVIRFQEVADLNFVFWLEFSGKLESKMLTKKTRYAAYLVYRLSADSRGLRFPAQETTIKVGMNESKSYVRLNPYRVNRYDEALGERIEELKEREVSNEIRVPSTRNDGWSEIEMGEFYNDNGDDGEIHICLLETRGGNVKCGLRIYGIEVRPKK